MCKHRQASLVQVEHSKEGMVLTWQCDDCGSHLWDRPVPDGTFDEWMWGTREVPNMDLPAQHEALYRLVASAVATVFAVEE